MNYLDFDIEIRAKQDEFEVTVRSSVGESTYLANFPFTDAQLETHLIKLENAILRSTRRRRRTLSPEEEQVKRFGEKLFGFVLTDEALALFRQCQQEAHQQGDGVRLRLHIHPPHLSLLPWEFLFDQRRTDYLCLDPYTPIVRYLDLAQTIPSLQVTPPLRILGMVASPNDLEPLDVDEEVARVEEAVAELQANGAVELVWLPDQSWRSLQREMRTGPWHIFHFIGHGGYDTNRNEGVVMFTNDRGEAHRISATQLSRLLARQRNALRLVLLNSCEGAHGGQNDVFSGTASTLLRSGIPAVLAMQYDITDDNALEFSRTFYEALADGLAVDTAVSDARNAINLQNEYSLEWGTPVLNMRSPNGQLFEIEQFPVERQPVTVSQAIRRDPALTIASELTVTKETSKSKPPGPIDFDWVSIPAGEFLMGSDPSVDSDARGNEQPQHTVYLSDYRISRTPVTVAQFAAFVEAEGYVTTAEKEGSSYGYTGEKWDWIKGAYWRQPRGPDSHVYDKADHPVTSVSWHDAVAFCQWAGVQLPTEAQWEKAARGADGRIYPWGNEKPTEALCNFGMKIGDTTPVERYEAGKSLYGCLDMAGNVLEWTADWFDKVD